MNKDETKQAIAVMQAWVDGKEIHYRRRPDGHWKPMGGPLWEWTDFDYRIKPEPREWLINIDTKNVGVEIQDLNSSIPLSPGVVRVREVIE